MVNGRGDTVALDHQQLRRNYAACIEGIDEWVGRMVQAVERRGELENTVIVFSSDHGEMLGDHGRFQKSVPWEGSVRVPLIVAGPGVAHGVVSDALVELADLAATMVELAGLAVPADWDSRSLLAVLGGSTSEHRDAQHVMLKRWRMVCDRQWKLVEHRDGGPALYDRLADPDELHNVAGGNAPVIARLSERLRQTFGDAWPQV
jgi:choline-sulfatase